MDNLSVSIAVCSKGRGEELRRLVQVLQHIPEKQNLSFFEIVVVEAMMPDLEPIKTNGVCIKYEMIEPSQGFGVMRQRAVLLAEGDMLVFIDDDCIPCVGWLSYLLTPFENNSVVAVGGGFIPQQGNAVAYATSLLGLPGGGFPRLIALQGKQEKTRNLSNGSLAMLRQSVLDIGGYNVDLQQGGEDSDLIARLKGITIFEPKGLVAHRNREGWLEVWQWFFRRGSAVALCGRFSGFSWHLRRSGAVKGSGILALFALLPFEAAMVLCIGYYSYNIFRTYQGNSPAIQSSEVAEQARTAALRSGALWIAPALRLWMDTAFDFGYWHEKIKLKVGK